jgi:hypothetical protein
VIVHQPQEFPHLLHLVLTFLTCGAWLPIYILHAILASRGGGKLLAYLVGVPVGLTFLACGGCLMVGMIGASTARKELKEADQQYAEGKRDEAVATYKRHFSLADDQAEILKRIVEHEVQKGNTTEAQKWVERGEKAKVAAAYESAVARELLAKVRKEREEQARAEREARAKARKERGREGTGERRVEATVTAADLLAQYEANEVAADERYKGKWIEVEGVVDRVGKDILDKPYVTLKGGKKFGIFSVQCYPTPRSGLGDLKPNHIITIRGRCKGKFGNVLLEDCEFGP